MARPIPEPRRQLNCRIPTELWNAVDARRIEAGLSRDEWLKRALTHVLATTTPYASNSPEVLAPLMPAPQSASTQR